MKLPSSRDHQGRHQIAERRPQNLPPPVIINCSKNVRHLITIFSLTSILNSLCRTHQALVLHQRYIEIIKTALTI